MGAVLRLPTPLERGPHNSGPAVCMGCQHKWTAVAPVGEQYLECPSCGTWKGVLMGPVYPEGAQWTCNCGCFVFVISETTNILCVNCGTVHGQQFFADSE